MGIIESKVDHLVFNADGASKDIKFQANGVEKASISSAGAFTSTTIDATKLTGSLPAIDGSSLTGTGKVLQVVQGSYSTTVSSSATGWIDSGTSASITPSSTTSKILVIANLKAQGSTVTGQAGFGVQIQKDSTVVYTGSNKDVYKYGQGDSGTGNIRGRAIVQYLDTPATTSAITYKLYGDNAVSSVLYMQDDGNTSYITLMEIGA